MLLLLLLLLLSLLLVVVAVAGGGVYFHCDIRQLQLQQLLTSWETMPAIAWLDKLLCLDILRIWIVVSSYQKQHNSKYV